MNTSVCTFSSAYHSIREKTAFGTVRMEVMNLEMVSLQLVSVSFFQSFWCGFKVETCSVHAADNVHRVRKKEATVFSASNINKCKHNIVIFGTNHPQDSFYLGNRKGIPNIITSLRSDDVIVTSSETSLSRTASRKDTTIFCLITLEN